MGGLGRLVALPRTTRQFWRGSAGWRRRYGVLGGLRIALALRADYRHVAGSLFAVPVPDLPRPVWLRAASADWEVFAQVCGRDDFGFPLRHPPEFILDAGANIGLASLTLATRFPLAKILAVEPDPENFALLCRNAAPYPHVTPLQAAVWKSDSSVELSSPRPGREHAIRASEAQDGGSGARRAAAWTIPTLLEHSGWPRFDLVKLDIEGAELEVLGEGDLGWLDDVVTLMVELHDRFRPGCREAFAGAVGDRGFEVVTAGEYRIARRRD